MPKERATRGYGADVWAVVEAALGAVTLGFLGRGTYLTGIWRRLGGAQEPSGGGCDARPGIVAGGWLVGNGLGVGPGWCSMDG